jgi:hypothetical protein
MARTQKACFAIVSNSNHTNVVLLILYPGDEILYSDKKCYLAHVTAQWTTAHVVINRIRLNSVMYLYSLQF